MEQALIRCPNCRTLNQAGVERCSRCGLRLATATGPDELRQCPACGRAVLPGDVYCDYCGRRLPPPAQARFTIRSQGAELLLPRVKKELLIGRVDPATGTFPDIDLRRYDGRTKGVSRLHARLLQREGGYYLEDLESLNHTYVNRRRADPGQPHQLRDGDEVRLGRLRLVFHVD